SWVFPFFPCKESRPVWPSDLETRGLAAGRTTEMTQCRGMPGAQARKSKKGGARHLRGRRHEALPTSYGKTRFFGIGGPSTASHRRSETRPSSTERRRRPLPPP